MGADERCKRRYFNRNNDVLRWGGLGQVAMQAEIPVAFGVLTTENIEQAIERAGTKAGNKGAEAALTALEMVNLLQQIDAA